MIFGHAKDGNIHFMLTDRFERPSSSRRYAGFTEDLVDLVLDNGGSLKAEHGTGRVMAPFVRRQYGDELYDVMREVKRLFDPRGLLNPGVVISDDPQAHLRHIKIDAARSRRRSTAASSAATASPSARRATSRSPRASASCSGARSAALELAGDTALAERLERAYEYPGVDTCAVDGMCGTACPVGINTGLLVKTLRRENLPAPTAAVWTAAAKHWGTTTALASAALTVADGASRSRPRPPSAGARAVLGADTVPLWSPDLPARRRAPTPRPAPSSAARRGLPARLRQRHVRSRGGTGGPGQRSRTCAPRPGSTLLVPDGIDVAVLRHAVVVEGDRRGRTRRCASGCCPWSATATDGGRLPVVCDASSCTEGFRAPARATQVQVIDVVAFVAERVLPVLGPYRGWRR